MNSERKNCGDCRFFYPYQSSSDDLNGAHGECRKFAFGPTISRQQLIITTRANYTSWEALNYPAPDLFVINNFPEVRNQMERRQCFTPKVEE